MTSLRDDLQRLTSCELLTSTQERAVIQHRLHQALSPGAEVLIEALPELKRLSQAGRYIELRDTVRITLIRALKAEEA